MNLNDILYKPKRVSAQYILSIRKKELAFLTSMALLCSLSSDISVYGKTISKEEKINDLKALSSFLILYDNYNYIDKVENLLSEQAIEAITTKEQASEDITIDKTKEPIPIFEEPAEFARYIRELLKDVPNEVKYNYILEHFQHTPFEVDVLQAVTCNEAKPVGETGNRYEDAFSVINNIYNRMRSKTKCRYVRVWTGKEGPITMYDHVTAPGQYQPYGDGTYTRYLGHTTSCTDEAYQAFLDFLYIADKGFGYMTNKLDFLANGLGYSHYEKYVPGGNEFGNPLTPSDTIPLEERDYYIAENEVELENEESIQEIEVTPTDEENMQEIDESTLEDVIVRVINGYEGLPTTPSEKEANLQTNENESPVIIIGDELFDEEFTDGNTLTLQR